MKTYLYHLPSEHPAAQAEPEKPDSVPFHAQWLAGTGAGSWFNLTPAPDGFVFIQRFAPDGTNECTRKHKIEGESPDFSKPYQFVYPSHCAACSLVQNHKLFQTIYIESHE